MCVCVGVCLNPLAVHLKLPQRCQSAVVVSSFSRVSLSVTLWAAACQAPLSMEFSRQEGWDGLPFPPPGDLPDPGIEPASPALADVLFITEPLRKPELALPQFKII